eukprot:TRINITY_DN6767_c0_g1_i2.p1 TRINITY_DN6767_c0_g1~~TRINITY_DN6767_c0_g1_i2.p1  ORF type:complete len:153 (+),score=23.52 TRINITY_DN6767_c0_g1_i2:885-1343(+)
MDIDYHHGSIIKPEGEGYTDAMTERSVLPVFVHIPKASGTSVMSLIHSQVHESQARFYRNPPKQWELAADATDPSINFLAGHVAIEQLQDIASDDDSARTFVPFTMLRDPRDRFISHWHWAKQFALEPLTLQAFAQRTLPNTMFHMLAPHWL